MTHFSDAHAVEGYLAGPPRLVPGLEALHRMTRILIAERAPTDARVLVLGAGGGLELRAFAEAQADWTFDGVDPALPMLQLAERTVGEHAPRVRFHHGYIDDAPEGPFDGAVSLLTLHFVEKDERRRTVAEVRRRLKPGAPFVAAHLSVPRADRSWWMGRFGDFAASSGVPREQAETNAQALESMLPILSPEEDEALLREAGFPDVRLFYAAFAFRGWVART